MASGNLNISGINFQLTKIWENSMPSSSINSGYLVIPDIEYADGILVFFKPNVDYDEYSSMICSLNNEHILYGYALGGTMKCTRKIEFYHATDGSYKIYLYGGYAGSSSDNKRCVPIFVYTYKFVITM